MPWELDIRVLDVGQGDSTLIIARELGVPAGSPPGTLPRHRMMLVDGGRTSYARHVHNAVVDAGLGLDHIVCTHYDADHSGGLHALLLADDLSNVVRALANAGNANLGPPGQDARQVAAAVAAAVDSAARGNTGAHAAAATAAATSARANADLSAAGTFIDALDEGVYWAELPATGFPALVANQKIRNKVARAVGLAAANSVANGETPVQTKGRIAQAVLDGLRNRVYGEHSRFFTSNRYNATHIIDLGNTPDTPKGPQTAANSWNGAITGNFTLSDGARTASTTRVRTSIPALCGEVLWNSGPNAVAPPAGAPQVYVVARSGRDWIGGANWQYTANVGYGNECSIGLLVRFGEFAYCTLGDMSSNGEDPLIAAIMANPVPAPGGGIAAPIPPRLASFKVSHHGSINSTSLNFLNAGDPATAFISSGASAHEHPDNTMVGRLHNLPNLTYFFMTNCKYETQYVAGSQGKNQLITLGNKGLVCGDNANDNLAAGRARGDIRLHIDSATASGAGRQYDVVYWEDDLAFPANRTVTIPF